MRTASSVFSNNYKSTIQIVHYNIMVSIISITRMSKKHDLFLFLLGIFVLWMIYNVEKGRRYRYKRYDQIVSENITIILTGFDDDVINKYDSIDLYRTSWNIIVIHSVMYELSRRIYYIHTWCISMYVCEWMIKYYVRLGYIMLFHTHASWYIYTRGFRVNISHRHTLKSRIVLTTALEHLVYNCAVCANTAAGHRHFVRGSLARGISAVA